MSDEIKVGSLVGVGGAACVVPETCEQCGKPAVEFEGQRSANPWNSRVIGYCRECADRKRAEAAWLDSLTAEDRARVVELWTRIDMAHTDAEGGPSKSYRDDARADIERFSAEMAAIRARTGYPG